MKKCAVINDLSGFGKCSLTAALPIISVMGSEAHPLPTAVLSNQTAYDTYSSLPLTDVMEDFISCWKRLGVHFDAILTGFFADARQLDIIEAFVREFKEENTLLIVDPVMADNGSLYGGYTPEMCDKVRRLCFEADVITPNICELSFLAREEPGEELDDLIYCGKKLQAAGMKKIAATGYKKDNTISNIIFDGGEISLITTAEKGGYYSGTGDIFASVVTGGILRGMSLYDAAALASSFLEKVILNTCAVDHNDGVDFEKYLGDLI